MPRVKKLAGLTFVTVLAVTLIVGLTPLVLAGHNGDKGSFDILVFENSNWQLQGELAFSDYETLELPLDNDAGQVSIKLVQHGHDGAYVDYVALQKDFVTYLPAGAINVNSNTNILNKIISPEYDVCDAWDNVLEIVWDNVPANTTLVMRAMEEDFGMGHGGPLYYPNIRCGETLGYTLVNDGGITVDGVLEETTQPAFSVFWQPDSPHPDGYTYGWLHCDEDYLYAAVEVTADNTPDEEDWGALYVMVDGELKEFRISCDDNQWGTSGFQYTPSVIYEHRIYEFQIPLSEINAHIGDEIHYGFGCYGTVTVLPDLVAQIDSVTFDEYANFTVDYTVTNVGTSPTPYYDGVTAKYINGVAMAARGCPPLAPGQSYSDTFGPEFHVGPCGGTFDITVCADDWHYYQESDEGNNCDTNTVAPPCPKPPGVPTLNHWGIVAMITLFAGLLVWTVRRKRLAS